MWNSFCAHLKECGRDGTLFIAALLTFLVGSVLVNQCVESHPDDAAIAFAIALVALAWLALLGLYPARHHHPRLGKLPPLSTVDLQAARAKLRGSRK